MLDIKFIRENIERVKKDAKNKNSDVDIDRLLEVDELRVKSVSKIESLRAERNQNSQALKSSEGKPDQEVIRKGRELKEEIQKLEEELRQVEDEYSNLLSAVPNVVTPDMPIGRDDSANVVLETIGEVSKFDFAIKDHIELGLEHGLIELAKASEVSGSRFYYLKSEAVLLQFAIINYVFGLLTNQDFIEEMARKVDHPLVRPFVPVVPPVLMKPEVMKKMDRLDPIEERYRTMQDGLVLVGSAEHTLGPLLMNELIDEEELPIRYIGYSTSFRREAGSHGQDVKGILRTHQFDKLEMETFVPEEYGEVEQKFILEIQKELVGRLEIPYQVLQICTGDTGKPDYNQFDIECWVPSQNKYRETHTSDYMTDYQARRLNIKYKTKTGQKKYVHMNDATAFAIGRILIAIFENNQQKDGSIVIPKALRDGVGKEKIG